MHTSAFRALLTALVLVLLLAPEAMLLHQCPCGKIVGCCCRLQVKVGEACQLHQKAHCSGGSESAPGSLQSLREPVDRPGTSPMSVRAIHLALAGRTPEENRVTVRERVPDPPVPPPRPLQAT